MSDLTRRGFVGFLASLPFVAPLVKAVAVEPAPISTEPGPCRWVPDCKTCNGTKLICIPVHATQIGWGHEIARVHRAYLQKDCPDCTAPKPREGFQFNTVDDCSCFHGTCESCLKHPIEIHWDTLNRDIWTRQKGGEWKNNGKLGVS